MNIEYLEIIVNASVCAGSLEVKALKRESDGAALWLTNNVHTLLVVWIWVRKIRRRYVA